MAIFGRQSGPESGSVPNRGLSPIGVCPQMGSDPDWGRRIAWLVGLWVAGVAALGLVALLLRLLMRLAGLTS